MWLGRNKGDLKKILANKAPESHGHAADFMGHSVANYIQVNKDFNALKSQNILP